MPRAIDVGTHVPHAAVRGVRDGGARARRRDRRRPRRDARRSCARRWRPARSASRPVAPHGHRDVHGEPVPGTFAADDELAALLDAMDDAGRGVFEVVPAGIGGIEGGDPEGAMEAELEWMLDLARRTAQPDHVPRDGAQRRPRRWRPLVRRGAPRSTRRAATSARRWPSRCFGVLFGHQSRMNPFRYRADATRALADLPFAERVAAAARPRVRAAILAEAPRATASPPRSTASPTHCSRTSSRSATSSTTSRPPEASVAAIAAARRASTRGSSCTTCMLGADGREFLLRPLLNFGGGSYDGLHDMMLDPIDACRASATAARTRRSSATRA